MMSAAHALTLEEGRYKYEKGGQGGSQWGVVCVCDCTCAHMCKERGRGREEEKGETLPSTERD